MNGKSDIKPGSEIYILVWKSCAALINDRIRRIEKWEAVKGTVFSVTIGTADDPTEPVYYAKFVGFDFDRGMFKEGEVQSNCVRATDPIFRDRTHAKAYGRWLRRHYSRRQSGDRFRQLNS